MLDTQARTLDRAAAPGHVVIATLGARNVDPGRFCRQVVANLLAINGPGLGEERPGLRSHVRDPQVCGLRSAAYLYLAILTGDVSRYADAFHVLRDDGSVLLATEVSFPP
jgi:hypothetical protein